MSHNFFDALMKYQELVPNEAAFPPESVDIGVTQQVWLDHMRVAVQGKTAAEDVIQRSLEIAKKRTEKDFSAKALTYLLERPGRVKILDRRSLVDSIGDAVSEAKASGSFAPTHVVAGPELFVRIIHALDESARFSAAPNPFPASPAIFGVKLVSAPITQDINPNLGLFISEGVRVYSTAESPMATKNSLGYEIRLRAAVYSHSGTFVLMG